MRSLRYSLCDVFTAQPLTGNALAVFTGAAGVGDATLQAIAREMNLSETVFVLPPEGEGQAKLRIFTPRRELPFAGHPIIGAAAVIGRTLTVDVLTLETGKGLVPVRLDREGPEVRSARMLQPVPTIAPFDRTDALVEALGLPAAPILPVEVYDNGPRHVLVGVDGPDTVRALEPDMGRLARLHDGTVAVFARSGDGLLSRVFVPELGVPEDPATGSAAGPTAWHAVRHGWLAEGRFVEIAQGEMIGRPSRLRARVEQGDAGPRIEVEGEVVIVGRGELRLPIFD